VRRPTLTRLFVAAVAAAGAVLAGAGSTPAGAAGPSVPATISGVQVSHGTLTGVLTVRAGTAVDQSSLVATLGGQSLQVATRPAGQVKRSVMLVVDTSGSMGAPGMATVREAVEGFLAAAPKDVSIGLTSFASTAGVDVPLTKDRARVQRAVNALVSRGETTLYDAVVTATRGLGATGERSIILLSDGGDTRSKASQATATNALKRAGVRAEVVAFKTGESDNSVLRGFAAAGGGSVAAAGNSKAVDAAFRAAAEALDSQLTFTLAVPDGLTAQQPLEVRGKAGDTTFVARTAVDLGAAAATPTPVAPTPEPDPLAEGPSVAGFTAGTKWAPLLLPVLAVFLGVLILGLAIAGPSFRSRRRERADSIERYVAPSTTLTAERPATVTPSAISTGLINIGDRVMEGRESTSRTMALIERADLSLRAGEWWVLRLISIVVGVAVVMLLLRGGTIMTLVAGFIGGVLGYVLPAMALRFLAKRRGKKFETQLPDTLQLVASSLTSGFSLLQALDAVAKDAPEPIAKEFARALAETRIGSDVSDSLERMATRMDSANMRWTTMAIRIQREVGGNLAETLRTTAKTLREREELHRHVRALSAEGRLSSYILIALPIFIFLFTVQRNREYVQLLWTHPLGWMMLGGGIVSMGIGIMWMRKVVDVQV
jgi:tight adherence protein B